MNKAAHGLAALGRHGDTMLVHMNPVEVAGLQRIAQAGGTSLTVNPKTGLPEAFNLKSLLPTIAGIIAAPFSGGSSLIPVLAGAATGAVTGDKDMSLLGRMGLGALGGFGGAGIGNAFGELGKNAALEASNAAAQSVYQGAGQNLLGNLAGTSVNDITKQAIGAGLAGNSAGAAANVLAPNAAGNIAREAFMKAMPLGKLGLAAAAAPAIGEAAMPAKFDVPEQKYKYYTTTYDPGSVNPEFGTPGENYFTGQKYGELVEHEFSDKDPFKIEPMGMAGGGEVVGEQPSVAPPPRMAPPPYLSPQRNAVDSYISNLNAKLTAAPNPMPENQPNSPAPTTPQVPASSGSPAMGGGLRYNPETQRFTDGGAGQYADLIRQFSGGRGFFAEGGITSLGGYSDGGRLLKGPGDGVSDDIPATIYKSDGSKQEARLADGEFVIDARTVSELGNGSTEAGARKLYEMMDRIHASRRKAKLGKDSKAEKHLPA